MTFFSNMAYLEREESSGEISHKSSGATCHGSYKEGR